MDLLVQGQILAQFARSALGWVWRNTHYPSPVKDNAKFMSPIEAVRLIGDGDVVADSGIGGTQRASVVYWAIRESFEKTGHPAGLTVMSIAGHGGRGLAPGTIEDLGRPGLCTRFVAGHFETCKAMLGLAAAGRCTLHCLPQGTMALLLDGLGAGRSSLLSRTGVGTFVDPRVGTGSAIAGGREQLISVRGERLRYRIPKIDVAVFNVPAADRKGNVYVKNAAMIGEAREIARAAKRNRGRVIANVGLVVDEGYGDVFLPADMIDAVVYYPDTEQAGGIPHRNHWPMFTTECDVSIAEGLERVRFVNWIAGFTPRRSAVDRAVARLAASVLAASVGKGALVNIGVGLPEEVCRVVFEAGLLDDLTLLTESGVIGGVPAPGIYFGTSVCPERIVSSAEIFKLCYERLDATCLGALQVDSQGNVNVSKRGPTIRDYVGPGGFIDLTTCARTIVFVSAWMARAVLEVDDGTVRIAREGTPKFVDRVDEITFNGPAALAAGKKVFYVTGVGVFRLTKRGVELVQRMPGIDVRRDILSRTSMKIVLPRGGRVPAVPRSIVTGQGFRLRVAGRRR